MVAILTFNVEVVAGDASHFNLPQVILHTKLCEEGQRFEKRTVRRKTHILAIRDVSGTEETSFCLLSPAELTCLIPAADVLTGFEFVQVSPLRHESPLSLLLLITAVMYLYKDHSVVLLRCAYKQPAGTGEKPVPRLCHRWDKSPAGLLCTSEMTGGCLKQLMVTQRLATGDTNKCTDTHNVLICTYQNQRIRPGIGAKLRAQTAAFNLGALWAHKAGK